MSPSSQNILVTGANGFIGAHIVAYALEQGHTVRGTARSGKSLSKLRETFPNSGDKLELAIVNDIKDPESYKDALNGVTAIIHTASPFSFNVEDNARDMLDPAIEGATAVLEAAKKYGPSVKHIVSTSSYAAIVDLTKGLRPGYSYTEEDWNPITYDEAAKGDAIMAYTGSKTVAERGQWDWMKTKSPSFALTCINPAWVFGPNVQAVPTSQLGQSSQKLYSLLDSKEVPQPDFGGAVDVRDTAIAHVNAIGNEKAAGKRFLLSKPWDWQSAVDDLREQLPELKSRLPVGEPGKRADQAVVDGKKASETLNFQYRPQKEMLKDTFTQYLQGEKMN